MGIFSRARSRNPAHPAYWKRKIARQTGATAFNKKHKIYSRYPDPRYWVSPLDFVPYAGQVGKGGKIVKATAKVVRRRQAALAYVKKGSRAIDNRSKSTTTTSRRKIRRYGVDDYY